MTTSPSELADRLADLADDGPHELAADGDLWTRGRRYQRRRRVVAGTLVALVVAGTAGLASTVVPAALDGVDPAAPGTPEVDPSGETLPLPDRLERPSGWTGGTADDGPLGPLVAVVGTERSQWWSSASIEPAGVSTAGEYRFLDLEGYDPVHADTLALSPDGRTVAYAHVGPTPQAPGDSDLATASGIALYDTVSGEVTTHAVDAPHGIDVVGIDWVDADTLMATYVSYDTAADGSGTSTGTGGPLLVWDVDDPAPRSVATEDLPDLGSASRFDGGLVEVRDGRFDIIASDGSITRGTRVPQAVDPSSASVNPDGSTVVWIDDSDSSAPLLMVADVSRPAGSVRSLGPAYSIAGWRDDDHVVARVEPDRLASVGLDGTSTTLVDVPGSDHAPGTLVADQALRGEVFDAPGPDRVLDPRLTIVLGALTALAALLLGVVIWRRRARLG